MTTASAGVKDCHMQGPVVGSVLCALAMHNIACWQHALTCVDHREPTRTQCTGLGQLAVACSTTVAWHSTRAVLWHDTVQLLQWRAHVIYQLAVSLQAPAPAAAAANAAKETPQERLKRLMQAQLNKAAQKDSLAVAQRKIQVCTRAESAAARTAVAAGHGSLEMQGPTGNIGWGWWFGLRVTCRLLSPT